LRGVTGLPMLVTQGHLDWPLSLDQGLRALRMSATELQRERLLGHLGMMLQWGRVHNLSAIRDPAHMVSLHLMDCLAVLPSLDDWVARRADRVLATAAEPDGVAAPLKILDVGSGAGLPGLVFAIMRPQWEVTCVDTVGKKAGFIRQVAGELMLSNVRVVHARVEAMQGPAAGFDLVTSRAFSSLVDLVALTRHLLAPWGCWAALKGKVPDDEIRALAGDVRMFHVEPLAVPGLEAARCLVWIEQGVAACIDRSSGS
jgi:16S rRNA (guanine527-N7)-methyltransferase